jgi:hypothetical protein
VWDSSLTFHKSREVLPKLRQVGGRGSRLGVWACRRLRQTRIQRLDEKRLLRAWRVGLRTRAEERMTHMQRPPTRGSGRAGSSDPEVSEAKFLHGFRVE